MRFLFKTAYEQDIRLFPDRVAAMWYGLLGVAVLLLPALLSSYYVGEITWVFIYGICGVSLMVLVGYTGLLSLGHAAFLGIGASAHNGLRHRGRVAGIAHDGDLPRYRHACLLCDHPGSVHTLGVSDQGFRRDGGRKTRHIRRSVQ